MILKFKFSITLLFITLFYLKGFSQKSMIEIKTNSRLKFFKLDDQIHFSVNDSLYRHKGNSFEYLTTSKLWNSEIIQIQDSLFSKRGGGSLFTLRNDFKLDTLIYAPKMEMSFFNAARFVHNDTIISFGGYGNFVMNNKLIFFTKENKAWGYLRDLTPESLKPPAGHVLLSSYYNGKFYVYRMLTKSEAPGPENREVNNSVFEFNLKTKSWSKYGKANKISILIDKGNKVFKLKDKFIVKNGNSIYLFNLKNHTWIEYENTSSILENIDTMIISNDDEIITATLTKNKIRVRSYPFEHFFKNKLNEGNIIQNKNLKYIGLLVLLIPFIIFIRKTSGSKALKNKTEKLIEKIKVDLSSKELELLNDLLTNSPDPVTFKKILSYFDEIINYESKKVKVRTTIKSLNTKLEKHLKSSSPLIIEKNKDDRRMYQVKFRS